MKTLHKILVLGISAMVFGTCAIAQASDQPVYTLSIAPQALDSALTQLATQSGIQLALNPPDCEGLLAPRLEGRYTLHAALQHLLANTTLRYELLNERMVAIRLKGTTTSSLRAVPDVGEQVGRIRLADARVAADRPADESAEAKNSESGNAADTDKKVSRSTNEVIVTGTKIRGVAPVGSPVEVFTREDIERTGAATPQQFLATLTQNFGGEYSDDSFTQPSGTNPLPDVSLGSGVNLRGLGASATLVLINGRRPAKGLANYVDISMIPLSAIERIEVLTDGQSAVYGSDAIGGVVNFITRSDYRGAETQLRGAISSRRDAEEFQGSQSFGTGWSSGSALLSYEHYRRGPVSSLDRDFSAGFGGGDEYDLLPKQERDSVFLSVKQDLMEHWRISADLAYSERVASPSASFVATNQLNLYRAAVKQPGGTLGMEIDLKDSWMLSASVTYGENKAVRDTTSTASGSSNLFKEVTESDQRSFDLSLTGDIFALPAGDIAVAIGAGYTEEALASYDGTTNLFDLSFNTRAVFAELMIPLHRSGASTDLLVSLTGRYEDYSNFGETFDPKFGIEWAATPSIRLKGSYGTSFKAPALFLLDESNALYTISSVAGTRSLNLIGNNSELHEERSTSWTAGMDLTPSILPRLSMKLNYFNIEYKDRIAAPNVGPLSDLIDRFRAAGLAVRRGDIPDAEFNSLVQSRLGRDAFWTGCREPGEVFPVNRVDPVTGACVVSPTAINALIDRRLTNLAEVRTSGLDATLNYRIDVTSRAGALDLGLSATYLFNNEQVLSSNTPARDIINTEYNPLHLRLRSNATWTQQNWSIGAFVNYANRYDNVRPSPPQEVASWTTVDLNARYNFSRSWLKDSALMLNIQNAFDANPPLLVNPTIPTIIPRTGYDYANADPMGRMFALTILKHW